MLFSCPISSLFWTHSPSRGGECLKRPCSFSTTSKWLLTYAQKSSMGIDPLYFTPFTKSLRNLRIFYLFAFQFIDSEITTCFWHIKWQVTYKGWGRAERRLQYCVYSLSPLLSLLSFFSRFLFIPSPTRKPFHSSVIAHAHLIYKTTEHLRATGCCYGKTMNITWISHTSGGKFIQQNRFKMFFFTIALEGSKAY